MAKREPPGPGEQETLFGYFREAALSGLEAPVEKVFSVQDVHVEVPAYAPIFSTVRCVRCGESLMEAKAILRGGETWCRPCSGEGYMELTGAGIQLVPAAPAPREPRKS